METMTKEKLSEVFFNVRKAYRLLFEYQSKILSLAKFIGDYFSYSYSGGWPLLSNACPTKGKGRLENWAWDWLNMYAYAFHFGSKQIQEENVIFEIRIYSDTGFYDSQTEDPLKIEAFTRENKSKTKIVLIASNLNWDPDKLLENFNSKTNEYSIRNEEFNMCAKSYDLEEFLSEETTINALKDFSEYCNKNNIKIR